MKNLWKKFREGLFTKSQFLTGMTLSFVLVSSLVYAFNQLSLNIFSANTTISSSQVNANFEYLNERIEALAESSQGMTVISTAPLNVASVARTTAQFFGDAAPVGTVCCTQYPVLGSFLDAAAPNQVGTSALDYVSNQYFEVQEDGFYMMYFSAKPTSYQSSSAYGVIYRKQPSSNQINTFAGFNFGWNSNATGQSVSRFLRSGDRIFFNILNTNPGGSTFDFEPGIRFTIKKL